MSSTDDRPSPSEVEALINSARRIVEEGLASAEECEPFACGHLNQRRGWRWAMFSALGSCATTWTLLPEWARLDAQRALQKGVPGSS